MRGTARRARKAGGTVVAPGVSPGYRQQKIPSPRGAKDFPSATIRELVSAARFRGLIEGSFSSRKISPGVSLDGSNQR
ncbi:MAG: hypothetical protein QOH41_3602 [Blastocatellia bacterium]|jgi:hypothetical protein|nr:hypothetical protein [Blastocatellia bacterium]